MDSAQVEAFLARWAGADGRERANYQLFLTELAAPLDLPRPEPATADDTANAYVFERRVGFRHGDGTESWGYIDLYRRGSFVLEAKDVRETSTSATTRACCAPARRPKTTPAPCPPKKAARHS